MQANLEKIPKFNPRNVNRGLLITVAIFLIILIACFATFGWVIDYKIGTSVIGTACTGCANGSSGPCKAPLDNVCSALVGGACSSGTSQCGSLDTSGGVCEKGSPSNECGLCSTEIECGNSNSDGKYCHLATQCSTSEVSAATGSTYVFTTSQSCDFSLEEAKCDSGTSDLDGDFKSAADVMAGLGSMCWIFLFINLLINIVILVEKFTSFNKIMTLVGLVLSCVTWLFLTCGWGHYADKKGGVPSGDVDYGASFAFVILLWLALFPYIFFWLVLWISVAEPEANAPEVDSKSSEPNSSEYPSKGDGSADGSAKQPEHSGVADNQQPTATTPDDQPKAGGDHCGDAV